MQASHPLDRAVFLDRDGTLNREVDYLSDPNDLELLPGAGEALRKLQDAGFMLAIVTNQSGIARGILDEEILSAIHERLRSDLAPFGVRLDWIGYCPHHPTVGSGYFRADCNCRKPAPGMLLECAAHIGIDLDRSWCIGDSLRDLDAAAAVGAKGILVRTGKGAGQEREAREAGRQVAVVEGMAEAAAMILGVG